MQNDNPSIETVPFQSDARLYPIFQNIFARSAHSPSEQELAQVRLLSAGAWPRIWKPDRVKEAQTLWRRTGREYLEATSKEAPEVEYQGPFLDAYEAAEQAMNQLLQQKDIRQTPTLPHTFLRRLSEQIDLSVFPYWSLQDCHWMDCPSNASLEASGVTHEEFLQFAHQRRFIQVQEWLMSLPLMADEMVYVAHFVEDTLLMKWQIIVNSWDAFAPIDGFSIINVVGDDPRWYLLFYQYGVGVFGCTIDYAKERDIILPAYAGSQERFDREVTIASVGGGFGHRTAFAEETLSQSTNEKRRL